MKARYLSYLYIALSFAFAGCKSDHGGDEPEPQLTGLRTVLVYQVANNNLGAAGYDRLDIAEMRKGAEAGDIPEGSNLLVYNAGYKRDPVLLNITPEGIDTLKVYPTNVYSIESKRMLEVFDDAQNLVPATKEFGLVLWSHGTGWLQDGIADEMDNAHPLSFGAESGRKMNISTLANVLEKGPALSFLYFDCCYMASVETLYQLRNVAPEIAGSCTELLVYGMPYDRNIQYFFADKPNLTEAAKSTFDLYDSQSGMDRTCTMSVVRTKNLDKLAKATEAIFSRADGTLPESFTPQRFMDQHTSNCSYFDFAQYVEALCVSDDGSERFTGAAGLLDNFRKALDETVIYKASTPRLWDAVELKYHSGLSTYILRDKSYISNNNYNTLDWYSDVASKLTFKTASK